MTSERQRAANKLNARASSGPRTHAGKARSSKNALRHGCAAPRLVAAHLSSEIDQLTRTLVREDSPLTMIEARAVAEAECTLRYVRRCKITLSDEIGTRPNLDSASGRPECRRHTVATVSERKRRTRLTKDLRSAVLELMRLDRYEKIALSRRNSILRQMQLKEAFQEIFAERTQLFRMISRF